MNKKTRPAYLGLMVGLTLIGLGLAYDKLWCDPRELLQEQADPQGLHRLSRDGVTVEFEARPLDGGGGYRLLDQEHDAEFEHRHGRDDQYRKSEDQLEHDRPRATRALSWVGRVRMRDAWFRGLHGISSRNAVRGAPCRDFSESVRKRENGG